MSRTISTDAVTVGNQTQQWLLADRKRRLAVCRPPARERNPLLVPGISRLTSTGPGRRYGKRKTGQWLILNCNGESTKGTEIQDEKQWMLRW
jgi:hypothetical protein